jgi:RNA recognition motif-containing protein
MPNKLFVCNIPYSMNSADLTAIFSLYGKVNFAIAIKDKGTGVPKGYGFVDMKTKEEMEIALEALNGRDINGRKLQVSVAQDRSNIESRPKARITITGTCILCGKDRVLAGFSEEQGICAACSEIMSNVHYHHGKASGYAEITEEAPVIECILSEK